MPYVGPGVIHMYQVCDYVFHFAVAIGLTFLAVFSSFFALQKLHTREIYNINMFCLERNNQRSTFTINIEFSLIHSMNIFICLQANIY